MRRYDWREEYGPVHGVELGSDPCLPSKLRGDVLPYPNLWGDHCRSLRPPGFCSQNFDPVEGSRGLAQATEDELSPALAADDPGLAPAVGYEPSPAVAADEPGLAPAVGYEPSPVQVEVHQGLDLAANCCRESGPVEGGCGPDPDPPDDYRSEFISQLKSEKGAVSVVEGTFIFPLVFLTVIFLIALAFLLTCGALESSRLRVTASQATTSSSFDRPAELESLNAGRGQGQADKHGLFLAKADFSLSQELGSLLPFRFFLQEAGGEVSTEMEASWNSTANNIWSYQALIGWAGELRDRE